MSKEKYQEILDKLLKQVYKELKKKMFPRKHFKLLYSDVDIAKRDFEGSTIGCYETEKTGENKYKHHIFISSDLLIFYDISRRFKKYHKKESKML